MSVVSAITSQLNGDAKGPVGLICAERNDIEGDATDTGASVCEAQTKKPQEFDGVEDKGADVAVVCSAANDAVSDPASEPVPVRDPSGKAQKDSGERKCLVSGEMKSREEMIRFVVGPDQAVVPDVAGKLPGRGLWVGADRALLETAFAKNPFSRAAKAKVSVPPDLMALIEKLLEKRCLELLGLGRSAGLVVTGQMQVEKEAKAHALSYLIVAADAGQDGLKKLAFIDIPLIRGLGRETLGAALGHDHLVYLGLRPHSLTKKLKLELMRWQGVTFGAMKTDHREQE